MIFYDVSRPRKPDFYLCLTEGKDIVQCEWWRNTWVPCLGAKLKDKITHWSPLPIIQFN